MQSEDEDRKGGSTTWPPDHAIADMYLVTRRGRVSSTFVSRPSGGRHRTGADDLTEETAQLFAFDG
jgi:hypothetical protein